MSNSLHSPLHGGPVCMTGPTSPLGTDQRVVAQWALALKAGDIVSTSSANVQITLSA